MAETVELRRVGKTFAEIVEATGVSQRSAHRASVGVVAKTAKEELEGSLEPGRVPEDRSAERQAARTGLLAEAPPVVTEGSHLAFVGSLVIIPALHAALAFSRQALDAADVFEQLLELSRGVRAAPV